MLYGALCTSGMDEFIKGKRNFVNIRQVAKLAGVSTATVSRVMNHPEKCRVETVEKVKSIIDEYNYVPNENVQSLIGGVSNTLAIFIQSIDNPFYSKLITAIDEQCLKNRYTLMICNTQNDIEKEKTYRDFCLAKRCKGIIVTEGISNNLFENMDIPLVWADRYDAQNSSFVTSTNYESSIEVVRYLYNLGHRKIAYVRNSLELQSIENRFKGYKDGLEQVGLSYDPQYVYNKKGELAPSLGEKAIRHFLRMADCPTAIYCANDMVALGVINEARRLGIQVPKELSVCGFDHVMDDYSFLKMTTVEQNIPLMAAAMVGILIGKTTYKERRISVPTKFISGETCAALITV